MNLNAPRLLRAMADRRVTRTPMRVLRGLSRQGKRRLPGGTRREIGGRGRPGLATLRFAMKWLGAERLTRHDDQWVINSFLPPFPSAAFDRMFENMLSGRRLSPTPRESGRWPRTTTRHKKRTEKSSDNRWPVGR